MPITRGQSEWMTPCPSAKGPLSQVKEVFEHAIKLKSFRLTQYLCQMKLHFIDHRLSKIPDLYIKLVGTN